MDPLEEMGDVNVVEVATSMLPESALFVFLFKNKEEDVDPIIGCWITAWFGVGTETV